MRQKNTGDSAMVLRETMGILDADTLLRAPAEDLPADAAVLAWSVLDVFEKKLTKTRKAELRDRLFQLAEDNGTRNEKGSFTFKLPGGGGSVQKQCRTGKVTFDTELLKQLLVQRGVPVENVVKPVVTEKIDEKAVEGLIAAGVLEMADLEDFSVVVPDTFALTVKKPEQITAILDRMNGD